MSPFPFAVTGDRFGLVRLKLGCRRETVGSWLGPDPMAATCGSPKTALPNREGGNGVEGTLSYLWSRGGDVVALAAYHRFHLRVVPRSSAQPRKHRVTFIAVLRCIIPICFLDLRIRRA